MPRRRFGRTDLTVSPIGLGTVSLGLSERVPTDADATAIVRALFNVGANVIDTAPVYGEAERRIGIALRDLEGEAPRDLVVATKVGYRPDPFDYSEAQTRACVDQSLRLLARDRLDLIYIHDVEVTAFDTVMNGSLVALRDLQTQGVVGYIGVSGGTVKVLRSYVETGEFDAVLTHNRYTLLDQPAGGLISRAHELGVAVTNAAPFSAGMLARPFDAGGTHTSGPFAALEFEQGRPDAMDRVRTIAKIVAAYGVDLPTAAVRFSTRNPEVQLTVLGAESSDEVAAAARAATMEIPDSMWAEIAEAAPPNLDDLPGEPSQVSD